ncbi:MAG: ABC transporter substrate-binding protein, partial [Dehalococcoidia bacterium]|nr:ABC transporter substrate-binding protein [Dehalococcoidia bacterium]
KGELDYVNVVARTLQTALLGEPVRVIMGQEAKASWHYILGPGLTDPQQLKGKPVAIAMMGGTDHYASIVSLKHLGLDPNKDVTFVVIPDYPNMVAALKSGSVSGGGLISPESNRAVSQGMKEVLWVGDILELPSGGLGTTVKKLQENPDQAKRIIRAYLRSMAYARDHKDEAIEFSMKEFELAKDVAEAVVTDELNAWAYDGNISDKGLENQIGAWKLAGGPQKDATLQQVKQAIDYTLLKEAQKELGLTK